MITCKNHVLLYFYHGVRLTLRSHRVCRLIIKGIFLSIVHWLRLVIPGKAFFTAVAFTPTLTDSLSFQSIKRKWSHQMLPWISIRLVSSQAQSAGWLAGWRAGWLFPRAPFFSHKYFYFIHKVSFLTFHDFQNYIKKKKNRKICYQYERIQISNIG